MKGNPKVILSAELCSRISRLHHHVGNIEWSGPIFYDVKGSFRKPDEMELHVREFMLKDIGSAGYTEYDFDGDIIDLYDENPELMTKKIGHLHTHHSMNVFFSGTDMQCLHDNAPAMDAFLSVIVNRAGDMKAKIAVIMDIELKSSFTWIRKKMSISNKVQNCLGIYNCEVEIEGEAELIEKINKLRGAKQKQITQGSSPSAPSTRKPNFGLQMEMFDKADRKAMIEEVNMRGYDVDNEELMTEEAIENMLCRSLACDDIWSQNLEATLDYAAGVVLEDEEDLAVSMIKDHFYETLQAEYYYDQFEHVIRTSIRLLAKHRDDYSFADKLSDILNGWIDDISEGVDGSLGDLEDFRESGRVGGLQSRKLRNNGRGSTTGKALAPSKEESENEF